jgi:hypothetical protein
MADVTIDQDPKFCIGCGKTKPRTREYFWPRAVMRDGFQSRCRECVLARPHVIASLATIEKSCTRCGVIKPKTAEFFTRKDGWRYNSWCRECCGSVQRASLEKKRRADGRPLRAEHWRRIREAAAAPEEVARRAQAKRERDRASTQKRRRSLSVRLARSISGTMRESLIRNGTRKDRRRWQDVVGYTVDDLKRHLERQFTKGMSWENHSRTGWHIDHIIPLASFSFASPDDPELRMAWALSNLRPMWAKQNIIKRAQRLTLL